MNASLQEIVDALSVQLGRPVLVDDGELRPLAYSTQFGELDPLRTASILGRAAPEWARTVLFGHGIRSATEPVHIPPDAANQMEARLCIPIVRGTRRLGYLWLLESRPVADAELDLARVSAADAAAILQTEADSQRDRRRREQELLAALLAGEPAAAAQLEADRYLPQRPLVVCVGEIVDLRVPAKHALFGGGAAILPAALVDALSGRVGVGDAIDDLRDVPRSHRRALAALEVADGGVRKWDDLRAQRLLSALPSTALGDLPEGVRALLENEQLSHTLETYLDLAGDVKRTAAELWLHRTSLYYRLRRIEEIAGVDLNRGEDRLLCHVALRLAKSA
ncbi:helix-turn-helix domain-containing protein [Solirubrobacter phytolaccae]|uniref:Helix-turn-helix domain-containing protein n=1 Tax=Solirubrobacter phytolaccae TaxID=1404360 RepID=A0A9X3NG66_9ACTN|nr:helix-turn-helix domain-containing protein [Solirubrobacter phytolaccae]MDA0185639.1 helix-turn-helix domain-containing protein [Solirubrobacter phytolaccae]